MIRGAPDHGGSGIQNSKTVSARLRREKEPAERISLASRSRVEKSWRDWWLESNEVYGRGH